MTFVSERLENQSILRIEGELDATSVPELRKTIEDLAEHTPCDVVVDLSRLTLIDSSGVGALVALYKRALARGHQVTLRGLRDQPLAVLRLLRLDRILQAA